MDIIIHPRLYSVDNRMNGELKDSKGTRCSLIDVLPQHGGTEEKIKTSVMIASVLPEISTYDPLNMSLEHCRYVNPLRLSL
jgi:hypothetical protein